ncbi:uncharacterized protein BDW43DRAFT_260814 [Aspergillus alliaceus]|uniref:uncharacterized protein n=1 Tax=Petromyces alliaceus TaxID=209559 RepID=UPI0012A3FE72|nr:uncharacterized protein BDW43DRAFT_260814 [Aspergillus alliaceus]KAB8239180.1 hypothetical protein BDW43DRAFT_260814 [Aspergillus alliaceus]
MAFGRISASLSRILTICSSCDSLYKLSDVRIVLDYGAFSYRRTVKRLTVYSLHVSCSNLRVLISLWEISVESCWAVVLPICLIQQIISLTCLNGVLVHRHAGRYSIQCLFLQCRYSVVRFNYNKLRLDRQVLMPGITRLVTEQAFIDFLLCTSTYENRPQ